MATEFEITSHAADVRRAHGSSIQEGPRQSPAKRVLWGEEESPKRISSGHSGMNALVANSRHK